jgi:TolB-like protein
MIWAEAARPPLKYLILKFIKIKEKEIMRKLYFVLMMVMAALNVFAQAYPRLMDNPPSQTPAPGQSLYSFTVKMRLDRSVVLSIDDVKIGHYFDGESVEIAVPDGKHIVRAYQMKWDDKFKGWREDDDDRLTDTLNGEKLPVEVNNGPKLKGGRTTKISVGNNVPAASGTSRPVIGQSTKPGVEGAVARASVVFVGELPKNSTIAVISISSSDLNMATFAIDELEYQLVTAKQFKIVDRKTLDTIRSEQKFQLSGEVSDQSAISIGNMLGASIVITGNISGIGNTQRLTLKALDVKTAQIITMARESF